MLRLRCVSHMSWISALCDCYTVQESQAGMLLGIMAVIKFVRRQSLDGFVSDMLFFSKRVMMLLCWYMDTRLLVVYGLVFLGKFC